MPKPESPRSRRERDARQRAEAAARERALRQASRRRAAVGIGVVIGVALAVVGVVVAATNESNRKKSATTSTTALGQKTSSTYDSGPPASLPPAAPGSTLTAAAPCPAADGSSPRVTKFAGPPPDCLRPGTRYTAEIDTSRGPITLFLSEAGPVINNFVFLARYHYWDGLPFSTVRRGAFAQVANPVNADGQPGPGYSLPIDASAPKTITSPLTAAFLPNSDGTYGGALVFGMPGDQYLQIPANSPPIGIVSDDRPDRSPQAPADQRTVTQQINDAATPSGTPSAVVTIDRVRITEEPA